MHRLFNAFISALVLTTLLQAQPTKTQTAPNRFAITHVTVIDVESGNRVADQTVIVEGNRISAVGSAARVKPPSGARGIDGTGKFLIPGLWDMHVHSLEQLGIDYSYGMEPYKLYVANGVTGVRDMGSSYIQLMVGKKRIEAEHVAAPRIFASGPLLEGGQPILVRALISKYVSTPESGRLAVDALKDAGVDFLKIHNGIPRNTYFAIAEEAKRKRIVFAGHVPDDVTTVEASDAGQKSIEHLASLTAMCQQSSGTGARGSNGQGSGARPVPLLDKAKCEDALQHLARNGTWLTPTLISSFPHTSANSPGLEANWRYIKPERRATCTPLPAQERPGAREIHHFNEQIVAMAAQAHVRLLAGTDTTTCRQPGFALLEELGLMVDAGLAPIDALRSATINPAIYFEMKKSLGTIAPGKLADLVLLDGDPLVDIHNTSRITAVVANGRLFDMNGRQKLLEEVLAASAE